MSKRAKMSTRHSRKTFTRGAQRVHPRNHRDISHVMRGGIRM